MCVCLCLCGSGSVLDSLTIAHIYIWITKWNLMTPIEMLPLSAIIINQGIESYKISPTLIGTFTDEVI